MPAVCLPIWSNDTLKHVYEKRQCKFPAGNNGFVPAAVIGYLLKVHGQGTLEETAGTNTERGWCASFVCAYEGISILIGRSESCKHVVERDHVDGDPGLEGAGSAWPSPVLYSSNRERFSRCQQTCRPRVYVRMMVSLEKIKASMM